MDNTCFVLFAGDPIIESIAARLPIVINTEEEKV
ncbi:hypothetical protein EBB45_15800 [Lysinibacillus composti]|uniref:Uncharacterized protein n=1 Tax=Lysinibacillus composti TaxID=720633 RepID=A0A3N9UAT7_9BACI|nr:hypothetical protein EBB45_15800 [Lysinibacillus composti]